MGAAPLPFTGDAAVAEHCVPKGSTVQPGNVAGSSQLVNTTQKSPGLRGFWKHI